MCGADADVRRWGINNPVWIYDNEPRNREIVNRIDRTIDKGDSVVIFPSSIDEKDINDMVIAGHDVQKIVECNTYSGLVAKLNLTPEESMSNGIKVKKFGRIESLDLDKMHLMVGEATTGLAGVSASQVEMKSGIQFYDGITTAEIQEILIKAASDLIDLEHPNYQFVAARLLLFSLRKQLYGKMRELPDLETHIMSCTNIEVYDKEIFLKYSKEGNCESKFLYRSSS